MDKNRDLNSIIDEVRELEYGDAFRAAAAKTENLINRIRAISDSETRHGFLCNYLAMMASLEQRVKLSDCTVEKRS